MTPTTFLETIIRPGLDDLRARGGPARTREAERFLLAIAVQESDLVARYQHSPSQVPGPARGWFQFEQIGVAGVLSHAVSRDLAHRICGRHHVIPHAAATWRAVEGHDLLAVQVARLLVLTHPKPLPTSQDEGWRQYLDLWRPGKPHPQRWPERWQQAEQATRGGTNNSIGNI